MGLDANNENEIVRLIHSTFERLPKKHKPKDGEWTTLSAIAVHSCGEWQLLSLATGVKCLPMKAVEDAEGIILHDWHAEIIAIRALNRFLVDECHMLATNLEARSMVIERRETLSPGDRPFTVRDDIRFIMYCSEAPCGDASMEIVMEAQEDDTPWASSQTSAEIDGRLLGRGFFDQLGRHQLTASEARADSPMTLSKSCSDKIALKQCTSLLAGPLSLLLAPEYAYIDTLLIPASQYRHNAFLRAFETSGRMQSLGGRKWPGNYKFSPFEIRTTDVEFAYSRKTKNNSCQRITDADKKIVSKASNMATMWTAPVSMANLAKSNSTPPATGLPLQVQPEVLVNGRKQGWKEGDPRGASRISRKKMWGAVAEVLSMVAIPTPSASTYEELKLSDALVERRLIKADVTAEALKGWSPNLMDSFAL